MVDLLVLDLYTRPDDELRQTYLTLFALGWTGRLTSEEKLLLNAIAAERTRRNEAHDHH